MPAPLHRILIANRGEIACRIARTLLRLRIEPVSVYTDADASSLHVRSAVRAERVSSYLSIEDMVQVAQRTGSDAVHPGYGFLSENVAFAEALAADNIHFIGPPPAALASMGDKLASKRIAAAAGVPTIPGYSGVVRDAQHALELARTIAYPVMLKASAGGGGKGMRIAFDDAQLREAFTLCAAEAQGAFGDARLLIEKYIEDARHIEVQILADRHGHVVALPERECSVQRRNQKVLEESPSPLVDVAMRQQLSEEAIALARAVGYQSAGTVEFVVNGRDRSHYFLEMNTRLQVEHPVTEAVTGLDLVEQMVRVARGEKLDLGEVVPPHGWAIEARVYAEDASSGTFLPSCGRLRRMREPPIETGVRIDTGFEEGDTVSVYFDPMLSKVVAHGADREQARERLLRALDGYVVDGVQTNIALLRDICGGCEAFVQGTMTTSLLRDYRMRFGEEQVRQALRVLAQEATVAGSPPPVMAYVRDYGPVPIESTSAADALLVHRLPPRRAPRLLVHGVPLEILRLYNAEEWRLWQSIRPAHPATDQASASASLRELRAPMPGQLVALLIQPGERVQAGQEVAVLEAMKMRNVLRAPDVGDSLVVQQLPVNIGCLVQKGDLIVAFE
ncbi:hypothetical protein CDCA_CDCA16G4258 [Cyanidium caldarium]|uniref:Propionyl-CoA carboxylase n=1 Tax=Cyanidium caldarium TaxID=2771 RepID=A0AAV9J2G0_CYACA|nr:hypothetical protein CDCA_CDCA16G4258 [Cyanidium caldarium]